jgi:hypothetical protein
MTYDCDAAGTKYKYVSDTTTIKYAGAFEFNHLYAVGKIATSEGQVIPTGDSLLLKTTKAMYGRGRAPLVYDEKGKILQKTDYYPFGLSIKRNSPVTTPAVRNAVNRYMYNEKELQPGSGYLDYGARMYMPEVGSGALSIP